MNKDLIPQKFFANVDLIRATRCDNATREPLCFAAVSFFFSSARGLRSPRSIGRLPRKFATWSEMGAILKTMSEIWGSSSKKLSRKTCFWRDFGRLNSHFDREYFRNRTIYRQSENGVANYDLSRVCWHNLVNFGPQTAKNRTVVLTHPQEDRTIISACWSVSSLLLF